MNSKIKPFVPALIPGFIDTSAIRLKGGNNAELGTIGVNANAKSPTNLVFSISPDLAEKAGLTGDDKVSIHFKGKTFIIMKGGHRMLKKDGSQLRCGTASLYLIDEHARVKAEVVAADLSDKERPVPAYIKFELPDNAKKNPKYFKLPDQDDPTDVPDNTGDSFDDEQPAK